MMYSRGREPPYRGYFDHLRTMGDDGDMDSTRWSVAGLCVNLTPAPYIPPAVRNDDLEEQLNLPPFVSREALH
jgi:hypothetical protein